ncbi:thiamine pyrophosphate-binding protein [Roseomonas sp. CCTCC AB2023176]|uniref:thiamine pyrophosphate-binding protein n=1 Tax=Roseomonas sp. CCTCC AB2023176 TaxID=3342640 RepID=UPI0035E271E3
MVERALRLTLAPPQGPVHLDLAPDTAAYIAPPGLTRPSTPVTLHPAPAPDDPAVRALRDRLAGSERPIVIAGTEAVAGDARQALRDLARRHGVPVVTTYRAKGIVDETLPGALGAAGLSPLADRLLMPLIRAADLVLLVGYDPIEMRVGWMDALGDAARVVELSAQPPDHGMHAAGLAINGRCGPILDAAIRDLPMRPRWPGDAPAAVRAGLREAFTPTGDWGPGVVFATLAAALPADAIVTADSGAHRILLSQAWQCREPLTLLQSSGYCTMGVAVPMAIGAALERPGCRCVAVTGDGGLEMVAGELATIRDLGVPITILVLQDESLGLIELKQRSAGLPRAAVTLGRTGFDRLAEAFGGVGAVVEDRAALRIALDASFARPGLSVVCARISADDYSGRL